jgi:signal transduction histidine kinase
VLLELISSRAMTAEEFISISGKLKTNIDNTQQTLENLLNWSLTQMQGIKTDVKEISLSDALNQTCNLLEETAAAKQITIFKEIPEHAHAMADPNQLQIILRNLVHNAIKFSKAGSIVKLFVKPVGTYWKIIIEDTGIGMSQEEVNGLLTANSYFSKSGTQQEKGTGLGLLLCKEFIKLNNGELEIKSDPGKGSTISVSIPQG